MPSMFGALNYDPREGIGVERKMLAACASRGGESHATHHGPNPLLGVRGNSRQVQRSLVLNRARTIVAAIDGEIYNGPEIRRAAGLQAGRSAYEALIPLFEKHGKEFPRYLNGVFALALWNNDSRTLYLVRDHLGSRSLFYGRVGDTLYFASTLRAILAASAAPPDLDRAALHAYFSSTAIPAPATLFRGISCVRPGSVVTWRDGVVEDYQYWDSDTICEDRTRGEHEWAEEVRCLLLDAITIRATSDEPYGSLVSGGLDTSVIAATLATRFQSSNRCLPVYSVVFDQAYYSDAPLQSIIYRRYPVAPDAVTLSSSDFADRLAKGAAALDKPVNDNAFAGMFAAFELAARGGCVAVFDGEGADELFFTGHAFGELSFQKFLVAPFWLRRLLLGTLVPSLPVGDSLGHKGRRFLYRLSLPDEVRTLTRLPSFYGHATSILRPAESLSCFDPLAEGKAYMRASALRDPLNRYHYGLVKTFLADDLLFKNERMASANGLLNRTPFIDYRLVELAFRIPQRFKLSRPTAGDDGTKKVYKAAVRGLVPDEILCRKKQRGFSQPSRVWYRGELRDFVRETLLASRALCRDYVDTNYVERLVSEHCAGRVNHDYLLSSVLIFELWLQAYLNAEHPRA